MKKKFLIKGSGQRTLIGAQYRKDKFGNINKEILGGNKNDRLRTSTREELRNERGEDISGNEIDRGNPREDSGINDERSKQESTDELLFQGEIEISDELRKRESSVNASTDVSREKTTNSFTGNREESKRVYRENETGDDEKLWDNGGIKSQRPDEMGGSHEQPKYNTKENDLRVDSLQLEDEEKKVEKATSFLNSKCMCCTWTYYLGNFNYIE
ncbi:hypothetical protein [Mycoplasmopsis californica]|nr:hypothetical protein [Mycoplasmopsis californica]